MNKRLYYIDCLKTISLFAIVVAHVQAPNVIAQIRSFDVILMVVCSGLLANHSNSVKSLRYLDYVVSRIKRLVLPTWIFLIAYFVFSYIIHQRQPAAVIVDTFLFQQTGIGYTWIIMVYLICALGLPFIKRVNPSIRSYLVWGGLLIIQEAICLFMAPRMNHYVESVVCYIIPYLFFYWIGYWYNDFNNKENRYLQIVLICAFIFLLLFNRLHGFSLNVSDYKYPPRIYYSAYGLLVSLWIVNISRIITKDMSNKIVIFISRWSLWIYLWHIIPVKLAEKMLTGKGLWGIRLLFVILVTGITIYAHSQIVQFIEKRIPAKYSGVLAVLKG